jgi:Predicted esterase of the alpha-beta hydrolase superfamily
MLGLILEGGGVKGAYHIGAIKALAEHGYVFDGYAGTSIGAVNAAMLTQGDWDKTLELWDTLGMATVLDVDDKNALRIFDGEVDLRVISGLGKTLINLGKIIDKSTEKLHAFLKSYIDEDAVRCSDKDFGLVTFSVPDFQPHYMMKEDIPESQLCDYVIASASYPLFKWQQISGNENKRFIDGGVYDNMPIKLLLNKGYKDFVVIRTRSKKPRRQVDETGLNMLYIVPSEKMSFALEFTRENILDYQNMGYYDAKRILLKLPSTKYCVACKDDAELYGFLETVDPEAIKAALRKLDVKPHRNFSANIEDVCDIAREELDLDDSTEDYRAFLSFLEVVGLAVKAEKYAFYSLPEFYAAVMCAAKKSRAISTSI